ncbi:hypothetical protein OEZ85_013381 [Tetradesmus obliquus]|uniref:Methyltransferase FkbM domain-containing protein n=1 Tax=Tetradesmus obliquus TaxID=3088 RepID=A0ABY8U8J4_TETOB|nr:hypothetical protein OEZ85_013381 [Tetradesmus obliquus]
MLDAVYTYYYAAVPAATDTYDALGARLDDPLGFRQHWLAAAGHPNISINAVKQQQREHPALKPQQLPGVRCDNSCYKARDGVCDEGRRGNITAAGRVAWVRCDLGTDCHDCGPWQGLQHGPAWSEGVGPIAYLQLHGVPEVRLRRVPHPPGFLFAYTDPAHDTDQSAQMSAAGMVEPGISQIVFAALRSRCNASAPGSCGLVLDVGANMGWYSLLAAALGCSVVAVEPVPLFRAFLEYSAARNHLSHLMEVLPVLIAPEAAAPYTVNVPRSGSWGQAGVHVQQQTTHSMLQVPAKAARLDELAWYQQQQQPQLPQSFKEAAAAPSSSSSSMTDASGSSQGLSSRLLSSSSPIDMMKVDVEGHEPDVFDSAQQLLRSGRVQHIVFEYSPGHFVHRLHDMERLPQLLLGLIRQQYSLVHVPWHMAHDAGAVSQQGWGAPLPQMETISSSQLAYDMWTAQQLRDGTLPGMHGAASWPCPEMAAAGLTHSDHPQDHDYAALFHPKSFASHFPFNTNIWAAKNRQLQVPGEDMGANTEFFPYFYRASQQWFPLSANSDKHAHGLPWVYCEHVPPQLQVAQRCRCRNWDVCGQQQVAVQLCLQKKQTGYPDFENIV